MAYKKIDKNQNEIVDALRSAGCSVQSLAVVGSSGGKGTPDLLVGWNGKNILMEIKSGTNKLNTAQSSWQSKWQGRVYNVRTIEEAFVCVGLLFNNKQGK